MASPQTKNGYTPIANEIMEALAGIRISGEARQCLDVILRKTYGFNKKEDQISLSQFCLLTKMPKVSICRALLKLTKINIIINKKVNHNINSYVFNKDFDTWKPLTKRLIINKKVNNHLPKGKSPLTKRSPTKETITKETTTKEIYCKPSLPKEFSFPIQLKEMLGSKNKRLPIIAYYWVVKGFKYTNNEQYSAALKRELRAAGNLIGYTNDQIKRTCQWLKDNVDFKWTLETIIKYIDEPLEEMKSNGKQLTDKEVINKLKEKYDKKTSK